MKERLNLDYLNTFILAAETGKLNTTAELVYRSHSAVSTQIKKLEDQVGTSLFIRNKEHLTLTKAGETLYGCAQKILELNDCALSSLNNSNWEGSISFGLPTDYSELFISRIYPILIEKYPNLSFTTICSRSRELRKQVKEGRINVAIVAMEPQYSDDVFLWKEKLLWVAAKDFDWQSFSQLPIALFSDNCIVNNYSLHCLKKTRIDFNVVFTSTMLENIAHCVKNGVAVSLLPESLINNDFQILPENFLSCPHTLNLGLTWGENANFDMLDEFIKIINSTVSDIKYFNENN